MNLRSPAHYAPVLAVCALVACTNGGGLGSIGGSGGGPTPTPSPLPPTAIGVGIPTGKIGVENDPTWGTVSGYTQNQTSQVLAFAPGSKITIKNLSSSDPHTLNVIEQSSGPPAVWPHSPSLSFYPSGNGVLGNGYASGTLNPGASVTVKLNNPGIYLLGCAFHYAELAMRDVIQVSASATPGTNGVAGSGRLRGAAARSACSTAQDERRRIPAAPHRSDGTPLHAPIAGWESAGDNVRRRSLRRRLSVDQRAVFGRGARHRQGTHSGAARDHHARPGSRLARDDAQARQALRSRSALLARCRRKARATSAQSCTPSASSRWKANAATAIVTPRSFTSSTRQDT